MDKNHNDTISTLDVNDFRDRSLKVFTFKFKYNNIFHKLVNNITRKMIKLLKFVLHISQNLNKI